MLFKAQKLDKKELEVLALVDELKGKLSYLLRQPTRWTGVLRRSTFAKALRGSNSIEGYNVSPDDALAAVDKEEPLDQKAQAEAWLAVNSYREAMTYVLQLADDPYFRFSADLLRSLHFMMLQYDLSKSPGTWRPGYIAVRDDEKNEIMYEGPDAEQVPSLMDELVNSLNNDDEKMHPKVRGAMGHLNLVMIHPFRDGNGRMARCLQTLILAQSTGTLAPEFSSIEEYLGCNTKTYYDVLQTTSGKKWNPEGDTRLWIKFCLTAHYRQAITLLKRSREIHRLWEALEAEAKKHKLSERTMMALMDAGLGYKVRNATYRSAAEVSDQVASRDLKLLVLCGLLTATGVKRGRHYTASDLVKQIRESTREPKGIADPFGLFP